MLGTKGFLILSVITLISIFFILVRDYLDKNEKDTYTPLIEEFKTRINNNRKKK